MWMGVCTLDLEQGLPDQVGAQEDKVQCCEWQVSSCGGCGTSKGFAGGVRHP